MFEIVVLSIVFGLWLAAFDLTLLAISGFLQPRIIALPARVRATAIFVVRFTPLLLAGVVTLGVFLPAWWQHEPEKTGEALTLALIGAGLLAMAPVVEALRRGARMAARTQERLMVWRGRGQKSPLSAASAFDVVEVSGDDLALCVGGYFKPTIFASTTATRSLNPREQRVALAHETSHAVSRDPLRLLMMEACPDFLHLFSLDASWRHAFASAAEFAADARASRGDRGAALDLASALVKVARLGVASPAPSLSVASMMGETAELQARVEALATGPMDDGRVGRIPSAWGLVLVCLLICALGTQTSETAQRFTEAIVALLG